MFDFDDNPILLWGIIAVAAIVKVLLSEHHGIGRAVITVIAAVFFAATMTDFVVELTGWETIAGRNFIAASLALTGEEIARTLLRLLREPQLLFDAMRAWRGK